MIVPTLVREYLASEKKFGDSLDLGGKWDSDARVWRMPAERTHELVAACEGKQIRAGEVIPDKPEEPGLF